MFVLGIWRGYRFDQISIIVKGQGVEHQRGVSSNDALLT